MVWFISRHLIQAIEVDKQLPKLFAFLVIAIWLSQFGYRNLVIAIWLSQFGYRNLVIAIWLSQFGYRNLVIVSYTSVDSVICSSADDLTFCIFHSCGIAWISANT